MSAALPPVLSASDLALVVDPELARARTLPADAYISDEVFAWEQQVLFESAWVCVGRSSEVGKPNDQRSIAVGSQSVVLARDSDGILRGFFNTCRHRGHELLAPGACTNRASIVCPYHSWAFRLDGRLRVAARFTDMQGFDPDEWPLIPVQVAERFGWIFVAVREPSLDFDAWIGDLGDVVAPWALEQMIVCATQSYELQTNWKVVIENFSECYHCPAIHPELCRVSPPDSGVAFVQQSGLWTGAYLELRDQAETMSLDGSSGGQVLPSLTSEQARRVHGFNLTPNLLISLHPDYALSHRVIPLAPGRTAVECQWLFPAEVAQRAGFDPSYAVDFWDITNRQDFAACESVYRGMRSIGYRPGVFDERERFVRGFQAQVAQSYLQGHWVAVRGDLLGTLPVGLEAIGGVEHA